MSALRIMNSKLGLVSILVALVTVQRRSPGFDELPNRRGSIPMTGRELVPEAWKSGWVNSPRGFESRILRQTDQRNAGEDQAVPMDSAGATLWRF